MLTVVVKLVFVDESKRVYSAKIEILLIQKVRVGSQFVPTVDFEFEFEYDLLLDFFYISQKF